MVASHKMLHLIRMNLFDPIRLFTMYQVAIKRKRISNPNSMIVVATLEYTAFRAPEGGNA